MVTLYAFICIDNTSSCILSVTPCLVLFKAVLERLNTQHCLNP